MPCSASPRSCSLHYFGPGHAFAPETDTIACLSFDWLVATYIVAADRFGWVGDRRPVPAPVR